MAKLLLIDDSTDLRTLLELKFAELGHHVLTAADGVRGLQMVLNHPLDLVLLDLNMPHRDGLETLRLIHSTQPRLKVLIITALIDDAGRAEAQALGVAGILLKPVSFKELSAVVTAALEAPGR